MTLLIKNGRYAFLIRLAGLSMNILYAGDKSPMQRGFFQNNAGDLLSAVRFLGGLYNFCNCVIIFSLLLYNINSFIFSRIKNFK